MTDDAGFLTAIRAAPEDDTVRLVYADWLEERGEVRRAAFLRADVEAERTRCPDCERHAGDLLGLGRRVDFQRAQIDSANIGMFTSGGRAWVPDWLGSGESLSHFVSRVREHRPDCAACARHLRATRAVPQVTGVAGTTAAVLGVPLSALTARYAYKNAGGESSPGSIGYDLAFSRDDFRRGLIEELRLSPEALLGGVGRALFARHPVAAVTAVSYGSKDPHPGPWTWWESRGGYEHSHDGQDALPPAVFRRLAGGQRVGWLRAARRYPTQADALAALGAAVLAWLHADPMTPAEWEGLLRADEEAVAEEARRRQAAEDARAARQEELRPQYEAMKRVERERVGEQVRLGTLCPRCEFGYGWDGSRCAHCGFAAG